MCFLRSRKYSAAECCAEFFSPAPFFTTFGTCYTMNSRPVSEHPGAKDELIFYVWTDQARSPRET